MEQEEDEGGTVTSVPAGANRFRSRDTGDRPSFEVRYGINQTNLPMPGNAVPGAVSPKRSLARAG
jgi:hypothetical protein